MYPSRLMENKVGAMEYIFPVSFWICHLAWIFLTYVNAYANDPYKQLTWVA